MARFSKIKGRAQKLQFTRWFVFLAVCLAWGFTLLVFTLIWTAEKQTWLATTTLFFVPARDINADAAGTIDPISVRAVVVDAQTYRNWDGLSKHNQVLVRGLVETHRSFIIKHNQVDQYALRAVVSFQISGVNHANLETQCVIRHLRENMHLHRSITFAGAFLLCEFTVASQSIREPDVKITDFDLRVRVGNCSKFYELQWEPFGLQNNITCQDNRTWSVPLHTYAPSQAVLIHGQSSYQAARLLDQPKEYRAMVEKNCDRPSIGVCSGVLRQRVPQLHEWIQHTMGLGIVSDIYVYTAIDVAYNDTKAILASAEAEFGDHFSVIDWSSVYPYEHLFDFNQYLAYNDCLYRQQGKHDWLLFLDSDDFLVLPANQSKLAEFKQLFCDPALGEIRFPWPEWDYCCFFTDPNLVHLKSFDPKSVRKTMIRPETVSEMGVHFVRGKRKKIQTRILGLIAFPDKSTTHVWRKGMNQSKLDEHLKQDAYVKHQRCRPSSDTPNTCREDYLRRVGDPHQW